jgi:hypothetical protein
MNESISSLVFPQLLSMCHPYRRLLRAISAERFVLDDLAHFGEFRSPQGLPHCASGWTSGLCADGENAEDT